MKLLCVFALLFSGIQQADAQTTEAFDTSPTLISHPTVPSWKVQAEVTINGVVFTIDNAGNGGWAFATSGGFGNSSCINYNTAATTFVNIHRKDNLPFIFEGVWLDYTYVTTDPTNYPAPHLKVTYTGGSLPVENYNTNNQVILANKHTTVTNVQLWFSGLLNLNLDNLIIGTDPNAPATNTTGAPTAVATTLGYVSNSTSFNVSGVNLSGALTVAAPTGFEVSTNPTSGYATSISVGGAATLASTPIYIRLRSTTAVGNYSGNVTVSGGGAPTKTVAVPSSTVNATLLASISAKTDVNCFGNNTGSATVSTSGGTAPFTYLWTPSGGTAATITARTANTYVVTVTDAVGATAQATAIITQPTALTASITASTNAATYGGTGSATVTPAGGTPGYTYLWAPSGGSAATATGLLTGTYTVTVRDANNCATTASVFISQPDRPVVTSTGGTTVFTQGDNVASTPVVVDGGITVTDSDSPNLQTATVSITGGFQSGQDHLSFTAGNGISGVYTTATGVLALSGSSSVANWQAALRSVKYTNSSITPNTTNRVITFVANDGASNSVASTKTVSITATDQTPMVTTSGGTTAYVHPVSTTIDNAISITDTDNATLASGSVVITNFQTGDLLGFTGNASTGNIVAVPGGNGILNFSSAGATATLANWNAAYSLITFRSTATSPATANRSINFVVNDGTKTSSAATKTLSVTIPPMVSSITSVSTNGIYGVGNTIGIRINFTGNVDVTGQPQLLLETGATDELVNYASGSGTSSLLFNYVVKAGNVSADLDYTSSAALTLNGGTIKQQGSPNNAILTLPAPGAVGSLGANANIVIDGIVPAAPVVITVANGATVTVPNPAMTGTAEPNSTLTLYVDNIAVSTTIPVNAGGNWSYTSTIPDGPHSVKATTRDAAGNESVSSNVNAFNVNTSPTINVAGALSALTTSYGTASTSTAFNVSATNLTDQILITPPAGFEVSTNNTNFSNTVNIGAAGNVSSTAIYVRLSATANATSYSGNIVLKSPGAADVNQATVSSTINPQPLTIKATAKTKVYGTALVSGAGSADFGITAGTLRNGNLVNAVTVTYGTGALANAAVATYPNQIQPSLATGSNGFLTSNYSITYTTGDIVVTPAPLTITATGPAKPFGTAIPTGTSTTDFTAGATQNAEVVGTVLLTPDANGASAASPAGTAYTVTPSTATGTAGFTASNYTITYVNFNGVVGTSAQTITFNPLATVTYGAAPVNLTASASSGLAVSYSSSDNAVASIVGNQIQINGAGTVTITASQAGNANYDAATAVTQSLVIHPKALLITANNQSKTYGQTLANQNASSAFTAPALVGSETIGSISLTYTAGAAATDAVNVYTGSIQASNAIGGTFNANNYTITYASGDLTVGKAILVVKANNQPKVYGETLTATSGSTAFTSTGLQNGETIGSVTVSYGAGSAANAVVNTYAGSVTINTATGGNFNPLNYTTTYATGDIVVSPSALTVTASNRTKIYGDLVTFTGNEFTTIGLLNGNTVTAVTLNSSATAATALASATPYPIVASAATGTGLANYTITYVDGGLTVNKKTLTVSNTNRTKVYGDVLGNSDFVGSLTGVVNNDQISLTRSSTGSVITATTSATYPIVATLVDPNGKLSNYAVSNPSGTLMVLPKSLVITATNALKTYGDTYVFAGNAFSAVGLINNDAVASIGSSSTGAAATAGVTGSPYDIVPAAATGTGLTNYTITYLNGKLNVGKKALVITANDQSRFIGTANPVLTVKYSGFVNAETNTVLTTQPTVTTTANIASPLGVYPIVASGAAAVNYDISYVNGSLTVKPGAPTSISIVKNVVYENSPIATVIGTLSSTSDDPNATFTYTLVSGSNATDNGLFTISGNQVLANANLDYENKSAYNILVRSTTQYGFSLDQAFTLNILDVNEAPTLDAIANQTICYTVSPKTISLSGISAGPETTQNTVLTVQSNNPNLLSNLSITKNGSGTAVINYAVKPGAQGSAVITVLVKDDGGVDNGGVDAFTRTFNLTVNPLPEINVVSLAALNSLSKGEVTVLTATAPGAVSFTWASANGIISGQNTAVLNIRPTQTTTYTVTATNATGCSDVKSITIEVRDDYQAIVANNFLTPNGDGINDKWIINNIDQYPNNSVIVFDKGGRILYTKKTYDNSWDGTFNGAPLSEGTYYYILDFGDGRLKKKGFITVIRDSR